MKLSESSQKLDRTDAVPLYKQLKNVLMSTIRSSSPGEPLPTEGDLCQEFDVSRQTVRQAFSELVAEGHIVRRAGQGTFVNDRKIRRDTRWALQDFNREMRQYGIEPKTQILSLDVIEGKPYQSGKLAVPTGTALVFLRRLRFAGGWPLVVQNSYLPLELVKGLEQMAGELERESLHMIIEREFNKSFSSAERSVEAIPAPEIEANHLRIAPGSPMLYSETVWRVDDGSLVELAQEWYRGDRSQFGMRLGRESME